MHGLKGKLLGGIMDWTVCAGGERLLRSAFPERSHPATLRLSPGI